MAQCGDFETLKEICSSIRQSLEASGDWQQYKQQIIDLNKKHKARIESYKSDVEEADFEEVIEPEQQAAIDAEIEEDIPFEDEF